jgi:hypothetical protein
MRVTSRKSRVRESRLPGSVRAKPNGRATRPRSENIRYLLLKRTISRSVGLISSDLQIRPAPPFTCSRPQVYVASLISQA